jgi:hypothetical protein
MGEKRRRSKNAGGICEKHWTILTDYRQEDPNKKMKKERTRNDEGNHKWTRKRITKTVNEN